MLLNRNEVLKKSKRKYRKIHLWDAAKAFLEVFCSNTSLPHETRETSNKQPNLTPKESIKRTNKTKS